jgi:hypothetical protein
MWILQSCINVSKSGPFNAVQPVLNIKEQKCCQTWQDNFKQCTTNLHA